jgi:Tfp pilus assembly protein PilF
MDPAEFARVFWCFFSKQNILPAMSGAPALCQCASGLSRARCCGLDLQSLGATHAHRHLVPLEEQALQAHRTGDTATAERLALDVLELAPGRIDSLSILYALRKAEGKPAAAEALISRIVLLSPNNLWATTEFALLLLGKGALAEAERHARNAVRLAPDNAQSHNVLGMVLTEAYRPAIGEFHFRRALELAGVRDAVVLANLGLCLKNQGKMAEARALYEESLSLAPGMLHTLLGFARLEEADRNLGAAMALLDRAEALQPGNASVLLNRAIVLGRMGDEPAALALLDSMAERSAVLGASEYLEKGRLLDKIGRYDEAYAAYEEGKRRLREVTGTSYLAEHAQQTAARLKNFFTATRLKTLPVASVHRHVAQPIFVLGFPRSGTTLVEQTLSAHPHIAAGDELPIVAELTNLMPRMLDSPLSYPEALAELWMGDHRGDLDNLRDYYLQKVAQLGIVPEDARWFTDKMPLNETNLGLIALMFPEAPLVHVIRHPLDVVLSVFSNLLTHGYYCSYALESVARHVALIADLVEHYKTEMKLRYLAIRYEDIVDHQEASIRKILEFVGEDFDPHCLAFHENRRYARTASYAQVSERLYSRSRFRYLNYLPHLQPVIPILQPVIERLGYTV